MHSITKKNGSGEQLKQKKATDAASGTDSRITIVACPGPFGTLEQAAVAEKRVDWWDGDLTDDNACTESFAALELRHFLARCLGRPETEIHLATPDAIPDKGDVFLIGSALIDGTPSNPRMASCPEAADREFTPSTSESFRIHTFANDDQTITVIKGSDRIGALYGVYAYLEVLGVRFFGLGDQDTVLPDGPVVLPRDIDLTQEPHYLTRGYWVFEDFGDETFFLWMARNRMNLWGALSEQKTPLLKKLGMKLAVGQHDTLRLCLDPKREYPYNHPKFDGRDTSKPADPYAVSPDYAGDTDGDGKLSYFEAHPEWYGLRDGKRSDNLVELFGDNYCTSNADATRELAKNLVQLCIDGQWKHADLINFFMLDGGKWCECDACQQQGSYTDRILAIAHAMNIAIQEAQQQGQLHRAIQIAPPAYWETLSPPTKPLPADFDYDNCFVTFFPIERCFVHAMADSTCTEVNQRLRENLEGWTTDGTRHYKGSMLIGEYYNVSSLAALPVLLTRIITADLPWYYKLGNRHFHYMHVMTKLWGTWRLNQYLLGRLLWNTQADASAIIDEYFTRFYPTTSERMRDFYRELEYATANIKPLKHFIKDEPYALRRRLTDPNVTMFAHEHLQYAPSERDVNDGPSMVEIVAAIARARRLIDEALLECSDPTECSRLTEDERRFAYGEAMLLFYYDLVRTAIFHHRGDKQQASREFAAASRQAAILEKVVDFVQVCSSHCSFENGFHASQALDAYNFFKEKY